MKILVAFDSFKGCMTANDACRAAAEALREASKEAEVVCLPMSDGGEGMTECIAQAIDCTKIALRVHGPLMETVTAHYVVTTDGTTAFMEMAEASGLQLVPVHKRNPMLATTIGVGEMMLDAVRRGCRRIVIGIGGSATCDAGKGMVEYLRGHLPLPAEILVASDVSNPLYGPNGAAYVFAPQKGASADEVKLLDQRLRTFAAEAERDGIAPVSLATEPGAGAAGGLGYGLMAYLGARLTSGIDLVLDAVAFERHLLNADLVITGEGRSDRQTLMGKVPYGILKRANARRIPVVLLSGAIEDGKSLQEAGFSRVASINDGDERSLNELMARDVAMANLAEACKRLLAAWHTD